MEFIAAYVDYQQGLEENLLRTSRTEDPIFRHLDLYRADHIAVNKFQYTQ